jgi:AcrR family transcriptional regulator
MKREQKREQTKKQILEATKEIIREKGCARTTLQDILDRTGLSKGAIFHYVKSKDELLSLVLREKLEETDRQFQAAAEREVSFEGPMRAIADSMPQLEDAGNEGNRVLMYLLGNSDKPEVKEVLQQFYEQTVRLSRQWIDAGQRAGVIPADVDASKFAELFVLISLGIRMRSVMASGTFAFGGGDFAEWIADILRPKPESGIGSGKWESR